MDLMENKLKGYMKMCALLGRYNISTESLINEFKVVFEDDTIEYISKEDIDIIELILL